MKLKVYSKWILFVVTLIFLSSCNTQQPLYHGRPVFADLNPAILQHPMFNTAPLPQVKKLRYRSAAYPSGKVYSQYTIYPGKVRKHLAEYHTVEIPLKGNSLPIVNGEGVGYGGIFMLLYRKRGQVMNNSSFYQKYAMTSISQVRGHLFPLKVGNTLSFHYRAITTDMFKGKKEFGHKDWGKMVYQVIAKYDQYRNARAFVEGPIYKIKVMRSTRAQKQLHTQYTYYFSTKLGWYIWAQYFADNKIMSTQSRNVRFSPK